MTQMTMQPRCVWCDIEHRDFEVVGYSTGDIACGMCSRYSAPMTYAQYRMCRWPAFDTSRQTRPPCTTCHTRPGDLGALLDHLREAHPLLLPVPPP